jgi:guanosine-3',5'-bis(diphosphate) 3'-pyrophosphohydrolase
MSYHIPAPYPLNLQPAIDFAVVAHAGQYRSGALRRPYIEHPVDTARLMLKEAGIRDAALLTAAVLHATLENTAVRYADLLATFGAEVAELVLETTTPQGLVDPLRHEYQVANAPFLSLGARMILVADKTSGLREALARPPGCVPTYYFAKAERVVDQIRGANRTLEALFDEALDMGYVSYGVPEPQAA